MKTRIFKGTKGNVVCDYCKDKAFNLYAHIRKNHKYLIETYLKTINFEYRNCNKCKKIIVPRYKKSIGIYYFDKIKLFGEKLEKQRLLCEQCEQNILSHKEKMESVWGIGNDEYDDYLKKVNSKKANTLNNFIKKYGKEDGEVKYKKYKNLMSARYTTDWWIKKYGEKIGLTKQQEWKNKTNGSLQRYIDKFGYEEGNKKHKEFKERCSIFNSKH